MTNAPDNPLLVGDQLPRFSAIRPEHVQPAVELVCTALEAGLERLEQEAPATWEGLVEPLNDLEEPLSRTWGTLAHLVRVRATDALREAELEAQPRVISASMKVAQSRPLYDKLKALEGSPAFDDLDAGQQRAVRARVLGAELSGVSLDGDQKKRFEAISTELEELSTRFSNHVLDATNAWSLTLTEPAEVEGLPKTLLAICAGAARAAGHEEATAEGGPWRITLDFACFGSFMKHARRRDLREQAYKAYVTRASTGDLDNGPLIDRILGLRQELAALLGKGSYAEVSLARKMADSPGQVRDLLDELHLKSFAIALEEHEALVELARDDASLGVPADDLRQWDSAFLSERLRESLFDLRDEQTRPYLPLERVLGGLFALIRELFGVDVEEATDEVDRWHDDVRFFRLVDPVTREPQAGFYLDPYSRPADKRGGAWMDECRARRAKSGHVQLPVAYLVCNQTPPTGDVPSLMSFREVETLFHECGHGLQHMLTKVGHLDVSGINGVEWDAVELPSQFMENWCYQRGVLMGMSGHYETGEPLPEAFFKSIVAARTFQAASFMVRQIFFARVDLVLHHEGLKPGQSPVDVMREVAEDTVVMAPLPEDRFLNGFTHIFAGGYAAGYYSYKWAEVLAADAFGAFEDAGLDDAAKRAEVGRRFRDTILGEGGSRHPMEVFEAFRGRQPTPDALLRISGLL